MLTISSYLTKKERKKERKKEGATFIHEHDSCCVLSISGPKFWEGIEGVDVELLPNPNSPNPKP
jgi:hypothetical protein